MAFRNKLARKPMVVVELAAVEARMPGRIFCLKAQARVFAHLAPHREGRRHKRRARASCISGSILPPFRTAFDACFQRIVRWGSEADFGPVGSRLSLRIRSRFRS